MRRGWLTFLGVLLITAPLQAEQRPSGAALDDVFLWLASGIPSARVQRLAATENSIRACYVTLPCVHALQKAGAGQGLLQQLADRNNPQ